MDIEHLPGQVVVACDSHAPCANLSQNAYCYAGVDWDHPERMYCACANVESYAGDQCSDFTAGTYFWFVVTALGVAFCTWQFVRTAWKAVKLKTIANLNQRHERVTMVSCLALQVLVLLQLAITTFAVYTADLDLLGLTIFNYLGIINLFVLAQARLPLGWIKLFLSQKMVSSKYAFLWHHMTFFFVVFMLGYSALLYVLFTSHKHTEAALSTAIPVCLCMIALVKSILVCNAYFVRKHTSQSRTTKALHKIVAMSRKLLVSNGLMIVGNTIRALSGTMYFHTWFKIGVIGSSMAVCGVSYGASVVSNFIQENRNTRKVNATEQSNKTENKRPNPGKHDSPSIVGNNSILPESLA